MKTKQEVIIEAWGEMWPLVENDVDENGILYFQDPAEYDLDYGKITVLSRGSEWTEEAIIPSSIVGIKNNNGWYPIIELKSERFENDQMFEFFDLNGILMKGHFNKFHILRRGWEFTHFRPIVAFKPPLF